MYGCTLRVIYQAQYYFMFPKMYRRARSHLAQDKRAITTDYLLAFFSTMSFSELQLSYGALPEDYEWSAVQQDWKCRLCYKIASDDHCRSDMHANRVKWYGAAAMQRQQQELQSMGIVTVVSGPARQQQQPRQQQQQPQQQAWPGGAASGCRHPCSNPREWHGGPAAPAAAPATTAAAAAAAMAGGVARG